MVNEILGFNPRANEREENSPLGLVEASQDPYKWFRDRSVKVNTGGDSIYGVYRGITGDRQGVLCPYIQSVIPTAKGERELHELVEAPQFFGTGSGVGQIVISALSDEDFKKLIEYNRPRKEPEYQI